MRRGTMKIYLTEIENSSGKYYECCFTDTAGKFHNRKFVDMKDVKRLARLWGAKVIKINVGA